MKIVLTSDVANLGSAGDLKNVAPGYARNYLIPQGLAKAATPAALKQAERLRSASAQRDERLAERAVELAERLAAITLTFEAKAGEKGRLYGSITTGDIAAALSREIGESFDRRKHIVGDPIRQVGEHLVGVRLSAEVTAQVKVVINPIDGEPAVEPAPSAADEVAASQQTDGAEEEPSEIEGGGRAEPEIEQQEA